MKLVRFDGGKTGLMVQLDSGLHVIDIIGSLGGSRRAIPYRKASSTVS